MMQLEALIKELQAVFSLYGDVPVLLSVEALDDDDQEMFVHGDALGVAAEQDHDSDGMFVRIKGMFVRISGDGLGSLPETA